MAKVYTRVVFRMSDGAVLHAESYQHAGEVALCKGSVSIPTATVAEQELQAAQTQLLQQQSAALTEQARVQGLLSPLIFESAGVRPVMDAEGKIIAFDQIEDELDPLRKDIEKQFLERSQAALRGELPVSPGLLRDLADQERILSETLRRQLGPGFADSTPGIERLGRFEQGKLELLETARRGDITLGEQQSILRQTANQQLLQQLLGNVQGASTFPFQAAGGFGSAAAGFDNPLNRLVNQRLFQAELQQKAAGAQSGLFGDIFGAVGFAGGTALGAYLGGPLGAQVGGAAGKSLGSLAFDDLE